GKRLYGWPGRTMDKKRRRAECSEAKVQIFVPLVPRLFVEEIIVNGLYQVSFREEVKDYLRPLAHYFIEPEGGERGRAGDVFEMFLQIRIQPISKGIMSKNQFIELRGRPL